MECEVIIVPMEIKHLDGVFEIEEDSFPVPWSKNAFLKELDNKLAYYFVAVAGDGSGKIYGYGGMWHVVNEGHITNVAVSPEYRGYGIGKMLLNRLMDTAIELEMIGITLEVSINNQKAQRLYTSHGFKPEGIRKNYYEGTNDDAIIMWKYF